MTRTAWQFDERAKPAFFAACALLLASSLGFKWAVNALNVYLKKEPVELRAVLDTIPRKLGNWEAVGADNIYEQAMIEELGSNKYLDRDYVRDGNPRIRLNVHAVYYTGMIDAVPHIPARCLVASGLNAKTLPEDRPLAVDRSTWIVDELSNLATGMPYPAVKLRNDFTGDRLVRLPVGDLVLNVTEFEQGERRDLRVFGGYFFIANGQITPSPAGVKAMAFNPSEKYAYYCKVQFTYVGTATQEQYLALVGDLLGDFLPELMQRLPDWAEVERRGERADAPPLK